LLDVGLVPGAQVEVLRSVAAEGVMQLRISGTVQTIGVPAARAVLVEQQNKAD
jgi:Fe2+ transport system protein FeoA